jgi:2-octaprenyl-6-methoxyphenol hydroxylase
MNLGPEGRSFDVIIAGGGLIGASLACALAPLGLSVAVVEPIARDLDSQPSFDDRTLALSRSSCRILEGIGVWRFLQADATPIRRIIVTEMGRPGRVVLDPAETGLTEFGHVVEARRFGAALQQAIDGLETVEMLCPASVTRVSPSPEEIMVGVESDGVETEYRARLLVAADGAFSAIRGLLGIAATEHDYEQTAVICNIVPEFPHEGRAFERFTPTGPFAVLPHAGDRCGLVWSVSRSEAERLMALNEEAFLAEANRRFGAELGVLTRMGQRNAYPLRLVRATRDIDERVVILGNAAHAIHPVGAQGFNLGCRDVAVLAELLADRSGDPGAPEILRRYSDWRRPDHEQTIGLSDGLTRLFANGSMMASSLRSAGLIAHALLPSLRRRLAAGAMGYRGRIPRLAQGRSLAGVKQ